MERRHIDVDPFNKISFVRPPKIEIDKSELLTDISRSRVRWTNNGKLLNVTKSINTNRYLIAMKCLRQMNCGLKINPLDVFFLLFFRKGSHMWSNWWPYHQQQQQQQHRRCDKCAEYIVFFFFFYSLTPDDRHTTEIEPNRFFDVINQIEYETIERDNGTKFSIWICQ